MSFLSLYLEYTKEYESPSSFWKWSAFASIAAVLRDNTWLPDGDGRLYPNVYVLFLAGSGARKGRPVTTSEECVVSVNNTKVISGRASIQAILDELAHTETNAKTGKMVKGGSAIFYAPELAAGIVEDPAATGILTDIYDGKTNFTNRLRHSPKFRVDRIVFTAFMASNEALIKGVFDSRATHGGLLGRTFLIIPDEIRPPNFMPQGDPEKLVNIKEKLKKISELSGPFLIAPEALGEFKQWYDSFYGDFTKRKDSSGILSRTPTNVKKLAMLLAANRGSLVITKEEIDEAIHECLLLVPNYNSLIMSTGKSNLADAGALVMAELKKYPEGVSRKALLRQHWMDFDDGILEKVVVTLEQAEMIQSILSSTDVLYKLTPKAMAAMKGVS